MPGDQKDLVPGCQHRPKSSYEPARSYEGARRLVTAPHRNIYRRRRRLSMMRLGGNSERWRKATSHRKDDRTWCGRPSARPIYNVLLALTTAKLRLEAAPFVALGSALGSMGASRVFGTLLTATVAASSSSTASLQDAALWLSRFGVDPLLPRLTAYYGDADVQGADTTFRTTNEETVQLLSRAPSVTWDASSAEDKYILLMLDPDHPQRAQDGSNSGEMGPFLQWFVVNARESASSGHPVVDYVAPSVENGEGTHRYILLLLAQKRPGTLKGFIESRGPQWDFAGFLKTNEQALEPVAYNFFYATTDTVGGAAGRAERGSPGSASEYPKSEL